MNEVALDAVCVTEYHVGLVVVDGPGTEVLVSVLSKALARVGIVKVSVAIVKFSTMLPQATRKMTSTCDGVIALDIVERDAIGSGHGSHTSVLMSALYEVGIVTDTPVIPGIICQSSLLEAKGVLPNLAEEWSSAMLDMVTMSAAPLDTFGVELVPATQPFSPPAPEETDYTVLLDKFRDTLKVMGSMYDVCESARPVLVLVWCCAVDCYVL